ncbi:MAG: hypothetical protein C0592_10345 [Marinilabiliales bacterium]|nr:MAG: hypothetical protein C0592_10345 [Marinilabiliales bacterium]
MQENTCIILHTIKYGEKSLIIKALHKNGLKSYFLNNYTKKGKNIYPFLSWPLAIVELEEKIISKSSLPFARNLALAYVPRIISRDVMRQSVALFMADILYHFIREENDRIDSVFNYIVEAIKSLDTAENLSSCFSIKFGYDIADLIGYGINSGKKSESHFNTKELQFQSHKSPHCLSVAESETFKAILETDISLINRIKPEITVSKKLFQEMISFFKNKIPESGSLKSPQILHGLFK